jgi:hypothetical protein
MEVFKHDKRQRPVFRKTRAMTNDERILGWEGTAHLSLLILQGR